MVAANDLVQLEGSSSTGADQAERDAMHLARHREPAPRLGAQVSAQLVGTREAGGPRVASPRFIGSTHVTSSVPTP